jgi:hypothetical protein
MKKTLSVLTSSCLAIIFVVPCLAEDFSSPRATLETLFQAIRDRNKELCAACVSEELREEVLENWNESDLPDEFEYEILDEDIGEFEAVIKIKLVSDEYGEEEDELWLIKEADGWKITMETYDDYYEEMDTCLE